MERIEPALNVCFSTTEALFSKAIRWLTKSPVSHALITYQSHTLGRVMVMEATGRGFVMVPWRKWRRSNQLVARFRLTASQETQLAALHGLTDELGAEYDSTSLLGFVLRRWRKRSRNPFNHAGKLICSEAVALLLKKAGLDKFEEPDSWTPADLLAEALHRPDEFILVEAGPTLKAYRDALPPPSGKRPEPSPSPSDPER